MINGPTNKLVENNSFSIDPYVPTAVYISNDNTICVGGTSIQSINVAEKSQECGSDSGHKTYRPLIILNINGDIIRKSRPICTCLKSITRTKNGNIFVVDECEGNGKVIIIDDNEEEDNIYTGSKLTQFIF